MRRMVVGLAAALRVGLAAALLVSVAIGPASAQQPPNQGQVPALGFGGDTNIDPNQPIKSGFTLSVQVSSAQGNEPDLTGSYVVDPSGSIAMKLAGPVVVKGMTSLQAADKVALALKPYIKDPKVIVTIVATPKPVVLLGGQVGRTGPIQVSDNTTLAEVLTTLGVSDNADVSHVIITHTDERGNRTVRSFDFLRWLHPAPGEAPDETQNPVLQDRDFVFVPSRVVNAPGTVTVEGAVVRPGLVQTRVGVPMTLREALSLAGGPAPTAARRRVYVRRTTQANPLILDFDRVEADDPTQNITLQPEDVVYVEQLGTEQFVNMNGAFVRPGKLPYEKAITLTQAIGEASGLTPVAKEKDGRIYRHVNGSGDPTKTQIIAFNMIKIKKNQEPDVLLEPGDTVEMPSGSPPRQPLTALEQTQALLSIALIVDALFGGRRQF